MEKDCTKWYTNQPNLRRHARISHIKKESNLEKQEPPLLQILAPVFRQMTAATALIHVQQTKAPKKHAQFQVPEKQIATPEPKYACLFCPDKFTRKSASYQHMFDNHNAK